MVNFYFSVYRPVTQLPNETADEGIYNHQSEIYFVGKLFSSVIGKDLVNFKFKYIIDKMIELDPRKRYSSFHNISVDISQGVIGEINFTEDEKELYRDFAEILSNYILKHRNRYDPIEDPKVTISRLANLIRNSSLESYIQNNNQLINCFINNSYTFNPKTDIPVSIITDFYQLLQRLGYHKQKIVLDNINMRLSKIWIDFDIDDDDLPF